MAVEDVECVDYHFGLVFCCNQSRDVGARSRSCVRWWDWRARLRPPVRPGTHLPRTSQRAHTLGTGSPWQLLKLRPLSNFLSSGRPTFNRLTSLDGLLDLKAFDWIDCGLLLPTVFAGQVVARAGLSRAEQRYALQATPRGFHLPCETRRAHVCSASDICSAHCIPSTELRTRQRTALI